MTKSATTMLTKPQAVDRKRWEIGYITIGADMNGPRREGCLRSTGRESRTISLVGAAMSARHHLSATPDVVPDLALPTYSPQRRGYEGSAGRDGEGGGRRKAAPKALHLPPGIGRTWTSLMSSPPFFLCNHGAAKNITSSGAIRTFDV
ncbi:unnamed protein product, partial [Iphiclides podalirius]